MLATAHGFGARINAGTVGVQGGIRSYEMPGEEEREKRARGLLYPVDFFRRCNIVIHSRKLQTKKFAIGSDSCISLVSMEAPYPEGRPRGSVGLEVLLPPKGVAAKKPKQPQSPGSA